MGTLACLDVNNDTVDKNSHEDEEEKEKADFQEKEFVLVFCSIFCKYFIGHVEYQCAKIPIVEKRL